MDYAFDWEEKEGGLCAEADYPYTGREGQCEESQCDDVENSGLFDFGEFQV